MEETEEPERFREEKPRHEVNPGRNQPADFPVGKESTVPEEECGLLSPEQVENNHDHDISLGEPILTAEHADQS